MKVLLIFSIDFFLGFNFCRQFGTLAQRYQIPHAGVKDLTNLIDFVSN